MDETTLIDFDEIKHDTGRATLFDIDGDDIWIPNSLIVDIWDHDHQVEIPVWFAEKEGLV